MTDVTPSRGARESASSAASVSGVLTLSSSNRSADGEPRVGETVCETCPEAAFAAAAAGRRAADVVVEASSAWCRSARNRASEPLSDRIPPPRLRQPTEQQVCVQGRPARLHSHPPCRPPAGRKHVEWRVHEQHGCAARASHRRRARGRSSNSPCSSPSNRLRRFESKVSSPAYVAICMAVPGPTYAASEKLASEIFSGAIRSARANDGFSELDNRSSPTPQTSGGDRTGSE